MNRALPEMLHCLNMAAAGSGTDITVLERQRARMKSRHEQQVNQQEEETEQSYLMSGNEYSFFSTETQVTQAHSFQGLIDGTDSMLDQVIVNRALKADPDLENGWPDYGKFPVPGTGFGDGLGGFESCGYANGNGFDMNYVISRTTSCPPAAAAAISETAAANSADGKGGRESVLMEKLSSAAGRESFKKRKADKMQNSKVAAEDETRGKRMKSCAEEGESKITEQNNSKNNNSSSNNNNNQNKNNRETSGDTSKENSKVSEVQKPDYIHVRARRGQATDSHSLAERVRREKISERMKYLQDLVPGCNKITGKAGMLDEIINYVQSLQRQVEFLSMKLAAVNPRLDFNIDNLFTKEVFPTCTTSFPTIGVSPEMAANPSCLQFNQLQQVVSYCGMEMGIDTPDMGLRRTISTPVSIPETFIDTSCFSQMQPSLTWDADLQNLYGLEFQQGRSTSFPSQPFSGSIEGGNLKLEM